MSFFTVNTKELQETLKEVSQLDKKSQKAVVSALNKTAQAVRTAAAREVRKTYHVKHGEILRKIDISKATRNRMKVVLESRDRPIRLINFSVNPKGDSTKKPKALKAAVKREGGRKKVPGAFIAKVRGDHVGVFKRTPHSRHRKTDKGHWSEGPIDQLRGPAIPVMLSQPGVVKHIQDFAQEVVMTKLHHELKRQKVIK